MAINGTHMLFYTSEPEQLRTMLRDAFGFKHVDAGQGWLIFALPPGEVAVHPGDKNDVHELYLMTDDIRAFVDAMKKREVICSEPNDQGWGILSQMTLPGGGKLGVYQPRHARPEW